MLTEFDDNKDLQQSLQASCSFARGGVTLKDGQPWWDGGYSDSLPAPPPRLHSEPLSVVGVSPFSGPVDISPNMREPRLLPRHMQLTVMGLPVDVTARNFRSSFDCFIPTGTGTLKAYFNGGEDDGSRFLDRIHT